MKRACRLHGAHENRDAGVAVILTDGSSKDATNPRLTENL